jgi:hypothetical protein
LLPLFSRSTLFFVHLRAGGRSRLIWIRIVASRRPQAMTATTATSSQCPSGCEWATATLLLLGNSNAAIMRTNSREMGGMAGSKVPRMCKAGGEMWRMRGR